MELKYSQCVNNLRSSEIRNLMSLAVRPDIISFAGGMPGNSLLPVDEVMELYAELPQSVKQLAFQYGPTSGYPPLLNSVMDFMKRKGMQTDKNKLIITTGAMQAIDIVTKILIDPGDPIIVEYPCFIGALASFNAHLAKLVPVSLDSEGMKLDELERALNDYPNAKFIYMTPYFHNPAGIIYSKERKKAILDMVKGRNIVIFEDDCYGELYFHDEDKELCVPMKAEDPEDPIIIYTSSLSKVMGPGMRVGWLFANPDIIAKAEVAKQSLDACSSSLTQVLANEFLHSGRLYKYVEKMRVEYKFRADSMIEACKKFMPPEVTWVNPRGGFYLWLSLPEYMDATEILMDSIKAGAVFVSGKTFDPLAVRNDCIRLAYSNMSVGIIFTGVEIIANSIKKFLK